MTDARNCGGQPAAGTIDPISTTRTIPLSETDAKQDFESQLAELEALVEKLEAGDLNLDESLAYFKRGVELTRSCRSLLDDARNSVEVLLESEDENTAEPFEPGE